MDTITIFPIKHNIFTFGMFSPCSNEIEGKTRPRDSLNSKLGIRFEKLVDKKIMNMIMSIGNFLIIGSLLRFVK